MEKFNFNRFCQTLRWYVGVNFHTLMLWSVGSAVASFVGEMSVLTMANNNFYAVNVVSLSGFFTFCIILAAQIGLSSIFARFNDKRNRESLLMLPATNLEKFLSALIYVTVVWNLSIFASFALGDTLRALMQMLFFGNPWVSGVPFVIDDLTPNIFDGALRLHSTLFLGLQAVLICALCVWVHSVYTLGGTLLRRYTFALTSIAIFLVIALVAWVSKNLEVRMFSSNWEGGNLVTEEVGAASYVFAVVLPLLTAFNYWASYHIFKHFELITNKWTNYDILKR